MEVSHGGGTPLCRKAEILVENFEFDHSKDLSLVQVGVAADEFYP